MDRTLSTHAAQAETICENFAGQPEDDPDSKVVQVRAYIELFEYN